jgi:hypothetical protein
MEEMIIINTIKNENPLLPFLIAQPVKNELEYIDLIIFPSRDVDSVCNFLATLLEMGCVARVYPENPRLR